MKTTKRKVTVGAICGVLLCLVCVLLCGNIKQSSEVTETCKVVTPVEVEVEVEPAPEEVATPLVELFESTPVEEPVVVRPELILWGNCRVTAYCPCEKCCGKWAKNRPIDPDTGEQIVTGASGVRLRSKETCASSLPFGTEIYIPDLDLYLTVEDRAAKWIDDKYDSKYVDIYIDDHAECFKYLSGCNEWMEVYLVNEASK